MIISFLFIAFLSCTLRCNSNESAKANNTNMGDCSTMVYSTSGGYIVEHNGMFYFADPENEYKLYQMDSNLENKAQLSNMPNILDLRSNGDKLYYIKVGKKSALYSYDLIRHRETQVLNKNVYSYTIHEDRIYFSTWDTNEIYSANLNGNGIKRLCKLGRYVIFDLYVNENKLYCGMDEGMFWMNLDGPDLDGDCWYPRTLLAYNTKTSTMSISFLESCSESVWMLTAYIRRM